MVMKPPRGRARRAGPSHSRHIPQPRAAEPFCPPQPCLGSPGAGGDHGSASACPGPGTPQHRGHCSCHPLGRQRSPEQGAGVAAFPHVPVVPAPSCSSSGAPCQGHSEGRDGGTQSHGVHPGIQRCPLAPQPCPELFVRGEMSPARAGGCWQAPAPCGSRLLPQGVNSVARGTRSPFPLPAPGQLGGKPGGEQLGCTGPGWLRVPWVAKSALGGHVWGS